MHSIKILVFILTLSFLDNSYAQSLFFNNIEQFVCEVDSLADYTDLQYTETFALQKIDSINRIELAGKIVLVFNEEIEIVQCDEFGKENRLLESFPYFVNDRNAILTIEYSNEIKVEYKVGIVSTGNYAFLFKRKKKNKKVD